jgi:pimeloyl-ACP methyl ester carboxylesterase
MRIAVVAMWLRVAGVLAAVPSPAVMPTPLPRLERMVVVAPAETLAVMVPAELDRLGWTQVIVAGQGTSVTIALHLAAQSPSHVRGVVSMAGGPVSTQRTGGISTVLRFARLFDNPVGRATARRRFAKELRARGAYGVVAA